eukprot:CAMPEP_0182432036 /NCGR_PEP_ID=MMETSP1167-20130531/53504_1 /TAXON_ID=2988 /ORGANISM="Mallomonas Sp, Strain CCMP3275" /LENGTH=44 /DNA_ID= /DNA_START= /DNA_END= /DNA_ORIENTATION=
MILSTPNTALKEIISGAGACKRVSLVDTPIPEMKTEKAAMAMVM